MACMMEAIGDMTDDPLILNSLDRYTKTSPRLILEERSHCEVPAGCGGVVLRWMNTEIGVPANIWRTGVHPEQQLLDGKRMFSALPFISYGRHVLAFKYLKVDPAAGLLQFACLARAPGYPIVRGYDRDSAPAPEVAARLLVVSKSDDDWRYTIEEPSGDGWMLTDFDDSAWGILLERQLAEPKYGFHLRTQKKLAGFGAIPLGLPESVDSAPLTVWVRRTFDFILVADKTAPEVDSAPGGQDA